jgi:hypothetical protein
MSILVNGTEILTANTPGSPQTAAQLAAWVTTHASHPNYDITASGSAVTVTAKTAETATYDISTLTASADSTSASTITGTPSYTNGQAAVAGVRPTGFITFGGGTTSSTSNATINRTLSSNTKTITVGATTASTANPLTIGKNKTPAQAAAAVVSSIGTGGTIKAYIGGNAITPTCASQSSSVVCLVDNGSYTNGSAVTTGTTSNFGTLTKSTTATAGGVTPVTGVAASASFSFTNTAATNPTGFSVTVNGVNMMTASTPGSAMTSSQLASWVAANSTKAGYTITASGSTVTIRSTTTPGTNITSLVVAGSVPVMTTTTGAATAGRTATPAVAQSGWTNFKPAITGGTFSGGTDATVTGDACSGASCATKKHHHQYDDEFDVTGLNMLNASDILLNLDKAIPSTGLNFKVDRKSVV